MRTVDDINYATILTVKTLIKYLKQFNKDRTLRVIIGDPDDRMMYNVDEAHLISDVKYPTLIIKTTMSIPYPEAENDP